MSFAQTSMVRRKRKLPNIKGDVMNPRKKKTVGDYFLTHTVSWSTGRSYKFYDDENYAHQFVERSGEKHYGGQVGCKRCRRISGGRDGLLVQTNPSVLSALLGVAALVGLIAWALA